MEDGKRAPEKVKSKSLEIMKQKCVLLYFIFIQLTYLDY